jgi:tyrosine-protein phosphatase YwqE
MFRKKHSIVESGLLRGMTDIHTHLLYGVDDGMQTEEQTLTALTYLERQGVLRIYLTPHIMEDFPENSPESLGRHFKKLSMEYKGDIELKLSAEYMLDSRFEQHLNNEKDKPLVIAANYLLVETSCMNPPLNFHETVEKIKAKGYVIILAHPERYQYMEISDYGKLKEDRFVFFQLNLLSPTGYYGKQVRDKSKFLLDNDFYTFVGSDIHNPDSHAQAYHRKSLSPKQIDKIKDLIENNRGILYD